MATNDNPHALRLIQALDRIAGSEAAHALVARHPLSKGADAGRKFRWALDICATLCASYDPQTVRSIRRECSAGYAQVMLRQAFGKHVQIELLTSVKSGGRRCEMCVTLP